MAVVGLRDVKVSTRLDAGKEEQSAKPSVHDVKASTKPDTG